MGEIKSFEFKQFQIIQDKSAMKVGIDGVLLGAWADLAGSKRILDVGTGTGLIALMAVQRTEAIVDAVEIENDAALEAKLNFNNSVWSDMLNVFNSAFQYLEPSYKYDHIISNPPFFENSLKAESEKRSKARHSDSLSLKELINKAKSILKNDGKISLILPADKDEQLSQIANDAGLFFTRKCFVYPFRTKKPNRILVELVTIPCECLLYAISIRDNATNSYSEEFRDLTKDFYLSLK